MSKIQFKQFKTHQIIQNIHLKPTSHPGFIHAQRENRKFSQQKVGGLNGSLINVVTGSKEEF